MTLLVINKNIVCFLHKPNNKNVIKHNNNNANSAPTNVITKTSPIRPVDSQTSSAHNFA